MVSWRHHELPPASMAVVLAGQLLTLLQSLVGALASSAEHFTCLSCTGIHCFVPPKSAKGQGVHPAPVGPVFDGRDSPCTDDTVGSSVASRTVEADGAAVAKPACKGEGTGLYEAQGQVRPRYRADLWLRTQAESRLGKGRCCMCCHAPAGCAMADQARSPAACPVLWLHQLFE